MVQRPKWSPYLEEGTQNEPLDTVQIDGKHELHLAMGNLGGK